MRCVKQEAAGKESENQEDATIQFESRTKAEENKCNAMKESNEA